MGKRPFGLGNCGHILKSYASMIWFRSFLSDKKKKHQKPDIRGVTTSINCRKEMGNWGYNPTCRGLFHHIYNG